MILLEVKKLRRMRMGLLIFAIMVECGANSGKSIGYRFH